MGKQWAYRIMKVLLIFACIALFFWIMGNIGQKFQDSHWVTVAKSTETLTELALPGIAVCLSQPYKDPDLDPLYSSGTKINQVKIYTIFNKVHFHKETFDFNVYESSEVIAEVGPNWTLDPYGVGSYEKGRCFTLTNSNKVQALDLTFTLALYNSFTYDIYLYPQGIDFSKQLYLKRTNVHTAA